MLVNKLEDYELTWIVAYQRHITRKILRNSGSGNVFIYLWHQDIA